MQVNQLTIRTTGRRQVRVALATIAVLLALAAPHFASAHPLGNFTINHYSRIELSPQQVRIFYVLDMAEIPAFQALKNLDTNGNGQSDADELEIYKTSEVQKLYRNLQFSVDGRPVNLNPSPADISFPPGQGGLSLLRLTFWLTAPLPAGAADSRKVDYIDNNEPDRIGWREILVRAGEGVSINGASVSDKDVSNELRTYPSDLLNSPLRELNASFQFSTVTLGGPSSPAAQSQTQAPAVTAFGSAPNDAQFAKLITLPELAPSVVLLALLTAVGLGSLHALEPGHGKTTAAAYLVGSRATVRHAILLGLTITITHTSSVFLLGLVTLFLSQFIVPERLLPWLGLASGLIVIVMGMRMFISRLKDRGGPSDAHAHNGLGVHNHSAGLGHAHTSTAAKRPSGWRGVLTVGFAGGLVPCPAALIVLLSAIGLGRLGFGMLLIVAFSAGLALVLCLVGVSVLYGQRWLTQRGAQSWLARLGPRGAAALEKLPAFSGLLVVAAGVLLLYHALPFLKILL